MRNGVELTSGCLLTAREIEILQWVANGKTNEAIAMILHRSMNTVKNQLRLIFQKLDVVNRAQAVGEATRLGIMTHQDLSRSGSTMDATAHTGGRTCSTPST